MKIIISNEFARVNEVTVKRVDESKLLIDIPKKVSVVDLLKIYKLIMAWIYK